MVGFSGNGRDGTPTALGGGGPAGSAGAASPGVSQGSSTGQGNAGTGSSSISSKISLIQGDSKHFAQTPDGLKLKEMLNSRFDLEKLEGMKSLIARMTLGHDVSEFFPDVVKNVGCDATEVKKLVYMFVTHYAGRNQDTALLSISSFQKDMKSRNERTRANALKAMSSVRVEVVAPLVIIELKRAINDQSAYVRKAAAHAIPKVHDLDVEHEHLAELVEMLQVLLGDADFSVLAGAFFALSQVCPDRLDLVHKHYRHVVQFLPDVDEWGQQIILATLLRYARTQFTCPFAKDEGKTEPDAGGAAAGLPKKSGDASSDEEDLFSLTTAPVAAAGAVTSLTMDADLRALLNAASVLLTSQNAGVVLACASLYFYLAPPAEAAQCAKYLVGHVRRPKEISCQVLNAVASMCAVRPGMFAGCAKAFFLFDREPLECKRLKLDILTKLATPTNVTTILQELYSNLYSTDRALVVAVIDAICRVASQAPDVSERVVRGLLTLLKRRDTDAVASAVVAIRRLLQQNPEHRKVVRALIRALDETKVPSARASIVWIVGEHRKHVPEHAPDVLRKLAKSFRDESVEVKRQILNLAVKLYISDAKHTALLFQYVLDLCKYDLDFDLRDRARLIRASFLAKKAKKSAAPAAAAAAAGAAAGDAAVAALDPISAASPSASADAAGSGDSAQAKLIRRRMQELFLVDKPTPSVRSPFEERLEYTLGSLSASLGLHVEGYAALPDFPAVAPDPSTRETVKQRPRSASYEHMDSKRSARKSKRAAAAAAAASKKDNPDDFWADSDSDLEKFTSDEEFSSAEEDSAASGSASDSGSTDESGSDDGESSSSEEETSSEGDESGSESESDSDGGHAKGSRPRVNSDFEFEVLAPAAARASAPAAGTGGAAKPAPAASTASLIDPLDSAFGASASAKGSSAASSRASASAAAASHDLADLMTGVSFAEPVVEKPRDADSIFDALVEKAVRNE